ncbi:hypothetical protein Dimus_031751, partial [Dionaea muscipula]
PVHGEDELGLHAPPSSARNLSPSYGRQRWKCGFGDDVCSLREELDLIGVRPYAAFKLGQLLSSVKSHAQALLLFCVGHEPGLLQLIGLEKGKGARPPSEELSLPWSSAMHGPPLRWLDAIHLGQGEWKLGLLTKSSSSWPSPKIGILNLKFVESLPSSLIWSDEVCPPCELDEGDTLHVFGRGVIPCALEEGVTSHVLGEAPPPYPLATRLEGRSPRKLRIKLKSRSLGESSQSRLETTTLCVIDAAGTPRPLPGEGDIVPLELSNYESPLNYPKLELLSSSIFLIGGGAVRFHDPDDDDVRSYVGSEDDGLRTPPIKNLTGIPSLDETGVNEGEELEEGVVLIPSIVRGVKRDACQLIGGRELAVPLGGSACGFSSSMTPASYAKLWFMYEMMDGHRVELDPNGNILPPLAQAMANVSLVDQRVYRPETKGHMAKLMCRDLNWNMVQSLNIAGQLISVSQEAIVDRDAAWKKVKTLEEEITGLCELLKELTNKYNESQDSVQRLEGSLKKEKNQSTSCLTALEKAQSRYDGLERKIERLEKKISELEQQRPSSMDEMIDLWQASDEGMAAITELARPSTKAGYNMAFQHFASYLSEVPADMKWDSLPWPHDDIGVTDQNIPYYIADGPPPPIVTNAEEAGELGEVNIADP